jgi:hypothetical protein
MNRVLKLLKEIFVDQFLQHSDPFECDKYWPDNPGRIQSIQLELATGIVVGSRVRVKADGSEGIVSILEGVPAYKAYVDMIPGASGGYVYITMMVPSLNPAPQTSALNIYYLDELELVAI